MLKWPNWPNIGPTAGEPRDRILRDQLAGLLRQIDQDRAGFEQPHGLAAGPVGIDDRRDAVIGVERQELRLELLALADVDRDHLVGQAEFLERDVHLVTVRGWPGPALDHGHLLFAWLGAAAFRTRGPAARS
jgi:hypothetical protein